MKADIYTRSKAKLFRGFADSSRFQVLEALRGGPQCVSELMRATGLSQSNLSMHLACLRDCGLVRARRAGRFVNYELADATVKRMLEAADAVVRRVAKQIDACRRMGKGAGAHGRRKRDC